MAVSFPQGKFSQQRRSVSLFPEKTVDELSVLGEEQTAYDEAAASSAGAVNRDRITNDDGTINWWEVLAPLLSMGVGAAVGGGRGALIGGRAGAGYLQGRVESDERFRKQRAVNDALEAKRADAKWQRVLSTAKDLPADLRAKIYSKALQESGVTVSAEEIGTQIDLEAKQKKQKAILDQIKDMEEGANATPESIAAANDLRMKNYETIFLAPPTDADTARWSKHAETLIDGLGVSKETKSATKTKMQEDAIRAKWQRVEAEVKAKKATNPIDDPADRAKALVTARGRIVERVIDQARRRATAEQLQAMTSAMQGAATPEESIAALLGKSLAKPEDFVQAYVGIAADAPSLLQWKNPTTNNVETMPLEEVFAGESDILQASGGGSSQVAIVDALAGSGDFDGAADENAVFEILKQSSQAATIGEAGLRQLARGVWQKKAAMPVVAPGAAPAAADPDSAFKVEVRRIFGGSSVPTPTPASP